MKPPESRIGGLDFARKSALAGVAREGVCGGKNWRTAVPGNNPQVLATEYSVRQPGAIARSSGAKILELIVARRLSFLPLATPHPGNG